jgi:5-methylcytosine-specific restriction endonuclease McrA
MRNATNQACLVLNASYEAISICQARRALTLVVKDAAVIQEHTGREVHRGIMFPSVIRLKRYTYVPTRIQVLTRKNILSRDHCMCQYCDKKLPAGELTLDHVIPQSKGGPSTWDNLVAACSGCNRKKANKTLEESGMRLRRRPRPANVHTSRHILRSMGAEDERWQKYLFYDSTESSAVSRGVHP